MWLRDSYLYLVVIRYINCIQTLLGLNKVYAILIASETRIWYNRRLRQPFCFRPRFDCGSHFVNCHRIVQLFNVHVLGKGAKMAESKNFEESANFPHSSDSNVVCLYVCRCNYFR